MRRGVVLTIGFALLIVLAGCTTSPLNPDPTTGQSDTEPTTTAPPESGQSTTTRSTTTPTSTPEPTPTPTPTATPIPNPWNAKTVIIGVDDDAVGNRTVIPLVRQAVAWWNMTGKIYSDYEVRFILRPNATDPDILIQFKRNVYCKGDPNPIGCAPVLNADDTAHPPELVDVETGYDNATTLSILKHELGHVLGIEHGEEPSNIMAANIDSATVEAPNASERLFPWESRTLTVYIEEEGIALGGSASIRRSQIKQAFRFYETNRDDGWIDNVTFEFVDDEGKANFVIKASTETSCESDSCGQIYGQDPDDDGALEYYTYVPIEFSTTLPEENVAWHIAYWLGFALGAEDYNALPDDLRAQNRDGKWWQE